MGGLEKTIRGFAERDGEEVVKPELRMNFDLLTEGTTSTTSCSRSESANLISRMFSVKTDQHPNERECEPYAQELCATRLSDA